MSYRKPGTLRPSTAPTSPTVSVPPSTRLPWDRLPAALAPDQDYDASGCFSGGAVELPDGRQLLMYTDVQRHHNTEGFIQEIQTQCITFTRILSQMQGF